MTDEIAAYESTSSCTALVLVNKPKKTRWCRYCETWVSTRGFDAHTHFRHANQALQEFRWTMLRNQAHIFWEAMGGVREAWSNEVRPFDK